VAIRSGVLPVDQRTTPKATRSGTPRSKGYESTHSHHQTGASTTSTSTQHQTPASGNHTTTATPPIITSAPPTPTTNDPTTATTSSYSGTLSSPGGTIPVPAADGGGISCSGVSSSLCQQTISVSLPDGYSAVLSGPLVTGSHVTVLAKSRALSCQETIQVSALLDRSAAPDLLTVADTRSGTTGNGAAFIDLPQTGGYSYNVALPVAGGNYLQVLVQGALSEPDYDLSACTPQAQQRELATLEAATAAIADGVQLSSQP
jgi:hypothetical protein